MLEVNAHVNTQARFGCRTIVAEPKERRANKLTADYSKSWKGFNLGPQHNMMAFKVHRPMQSPTAVFGRYHVIHSSSIVYGDFMGAAFQKAARGVKMAREYFDAEVEKLYGANTEELVTIRLYSAAHGGVQPQLPTCHRHRCLAIQPHLSFPEQWHRP